VVDARSSDVAGHDLSGTWRAAVADDELVRWFADPEFDDGGWADVRVPSHWRSNDAFAETDGPLLYRTRFDTPIADPPDDWSALDTRWWLCLEGAFYSSDVWLDGDYVGDTEGYFFPHIFEVTDQLELGGEHTLAIDLTCSAQHDRRAKRNLTGVFQHWDCIDPEWNPGGLWRPVRLSTTGPVQIRHARVLCRDATTETATVFLRTVLDTRETRDVEIVTTLAGQRFVETRPLAAGENRVEWTVVVPEPELWWPHALGEQPLYDLAVEVRTEGRVADRRQWRIGLRSVQLRDWMLSVNGERLFLKGSNIGPTAMALGEASDAAIRRDVELGRAAGLDLLRVHAHVTRSALYEAADELGVLLWQDFPLQWGYARTVRRQARRQAREMVDLLAHHASIAVWCGHNEPLALDIDADAIADPQKTRSIAVRGALAMMLPTWNKTVLDHSVRRVLVRNDPSRPAVAHSGVFPHPPQFDGTDSHLYFGWYHGQERQFPQLLRWWPRLGRFVSEFGAQAVPEEASFCEPERWPDLDWSRLAHRHSLQKARFDVYVPPADHRTFDEWRAATQAYQAEVIRFHIEALRRIKYRPTGGFVQFCLTDAHPAVTWSVLDHERRPKAGHLALVAACAPVIVVADRLPEHVTAGEAVALDVHVVSDLRTALEGGVVTARLTWAGGGHEWRWQGDVPPDSCVRAGTLQFQAPDVASELCLDLAYECGVTTAANRYTSRVRDGRESASRMVHPDS
jgi:beta-mannosidase